MDLGGADFPGWLKRLTAGANMASCGEKCYGLQAMNKGGASI